MLESNLLKILNDIYSKDGAGEPETQYNSFTLGVVVDTDDPLQQGRLRVFCPSLNDNPKKIHHLPWATQVTPFGGSINNGSFTRGNDPANCLTTGATQYGFWGTPEQGAHVVVGCVDGDLRRRFYIGSMFEHQETHGMLTGRWNHEGGAVDGPLSSTNSPIQPQYSNLQKAFGGNNSREWKTRGADYQVAAVREDVGQLPNTNKRTYLDQQYDKIEANEEDSWVKPYLGAHGYDWSGHKGLGSFMANRGYGFSTPGFHALSMDDRAFNSRIKLRTGAGHQIIMDDTNERIYISTYEGNNYIEMDVSGNIDVYTKRRLSFHSEKDMNFTSDESIRMLAKKSINLYAGYNENQESLGEPPADGQVRIQAEDDIHVITKKNYRQLSFEDTLIEIGGKMCQSIGESLFLQVQNDINIITNTGDWNLTVTGNVNEIVNGNVNKFAAGNMTNAARGNAEMFSYAGKMDIGSQRTINIKSIAEDIAIEAIGSNQDSAAGVFIKTPESQYGISNEGVTTATNKSIRQKAAEDIEMSNAVPTDQEYPIPPSDIGPCLGSEPPPLSLDGYTKSDLTARAAYNAGFRGDALVTAVAIAGAESSHNPEAVGDVGLQNAKWGPSVGLWQMRTLNDPSAYAGSVDGGRDINALSGTSNVQNNANLAYALSKGGTNFRPWTTFTENTWQKSQYLDQAKGAVDRLCNPVLSSLPFEMPNVELFTASFGNVVSIINQCLPSFTPAMGNMLRFNGVGIDIQSLTDIAFKNNLSGFSTQLFDGIVQKIDDNAMAHNILSFATNTAFAAFATVGPILAGAAFVAQLLGAIDVITDMFDSLPPDFDLIASTLLANLGLNFDLSGICNYALPHFEPNPEVVFFLENHNVLDTTTLGMPGSSGSCDYADYVNSIDPDFTLDGA